jgi:SSS family solute:Na+ symporter
VSSLVTVATMAIKGLYANEPIIFGLLSSLVVYVGVSLATAPARASRGTRDTVGAAVV